VVPDEELSESQRPELEDERAFRRSVKNMVQNRELIETTERTR
jgi:hypothetical protein